MTPELKDGVHTLLDVDLNIDEALEYPTVDELRILAKKYL